MSRDITGDIGPLYPACGAEPKIPMFSFDRAAYTFWQGVFDSLIEKGLTEEQAIGWLQSKEARWALDGRAGDSLRDLGRSVGLAYGRVL